MNVIIIAALIGWCATIANQDPTWIANVNGAPLSIVAKGRTISIRNSTEGSVSSFRLGCIHIRPRRLVVVHHFAIEKIAIPPHGATIKASFDGVPDEQARCQGMRAKLTVLETTFENKDTWHFPVNSPFAPKVEGK